MIDAVLLKATLTKAAASDHYWKVTSVSLNKNA